MSQWFHRNVIKSTKTAKFELKQAVTNVETSKICSELCLRREQFLDLLKSASSDLELVESEFNHYLRLFYGFLFDIEDPTKNSKLRYLGGSFIWSNSLLTADAYEASDAWFEVLSICMNMAIWYMKWAALISAKDEVSVSDAKKMHTALQKAGGIFQFVLDNREKVGVIPGASGNDLDENVIQAYNVQCRAEAQEVTITRAIELKHNPQLISTLANQTACAYAACDKFIEKYNAEHFDKWRKYFQLKHKFYLTYAYSYEAERLLALDKCGDAMRACKEGCENYRLCSDLCKLYAKASGPGFIATPEKHIFFRRIEPILKRHAEKAERENRLIYHDKIPDECPLLTESAEYSLVSPTEFNYPQKAENWTLPTYHAFDITKISTPDFHAPKKVGKISLVREEKVYEIDKDRTNLGTCGVQ